MKKREAIRQLLNGLLKFGFKLSSSDHKNASSLVTPMETLGSFKSDISPSQELDLESGTSSYSSLKHQVVSLGRTTSSDMLQSLMKPNGEVEKNLSAILLADMFCAELETARRDLEARNIDIETEKSHVLDLESKLSQTMIAEFPIATTIRHISGQKTMRKQTRKK
ncbi:hypothetical protein ARALYDRAFT_916141 [Arabidopsis lyrata subsp. lyrata]|uniref:Uncharacterized protein n=1 Tax=Arabidopsis lyrata subsp. lyrata TaxID=81972 RepID=D7MJ26_ARALL|nr:hypothetical protein ARALYDRAFT_916141 [Arabidopsis lyrata subsp. lyrata]